MENAPERVLVQLDARRVVQLTGAGGDQVQRLDVVAHWAELHDQIAVQERVLGGPREDERSKADDERSLYFLYGFRGLQLKVFDGLADSSVRRI